MALGAILCCCSRPQSEGDQSTKCCNKSPPLIQEGGMFQILVKEGERVTSRSVPVKVPSPSKKIRKSQYFINNNLDVPVDVTIEYVSPEMDSRTVIFSGIVEDAYHSAIDAKGQAIAVSNKKIDYYFQIESTDAKPPSQELSSSDPSITRSSMVFNLLCCCCRKAKVERYEETPYHLNKKKKRPIVNGGCLEIMVHQRMTILTKSVPVITSMKQQISYYLVNATMEPMFVTITYIHPKSGNVVELVSGIIEDCHDSAINAHGKVVINKKRGFDYVFVVEYERNQELALRDMKISE